MLEVSMNKTLSRSNRAGFDQLGQKLKETTIAGRLKNQIPAPSV